VFGPVVGGALTSWNAVIGLPVLLAVSALALAMALLRLAKR
jgi:hypothetical protein